MRTASCSCGQLTVTCDGEPVRISICHCLNCQRRTGSPFAMQARWPPDRATISGTATEYAIVGDEGGRATFRFCPTCGATVYYTNEGSDLIAVPVGTFQEPTFPPPQYSVYTVRKHAWITIDGAIEQLD